MSKKKEDNRDVFDKALDDNNPYYLTGNEAVMGLLAAVPIGMIGGKAIAKRLASRKTREAEKAAMKRFKKSGKDWPEGKDAKTIARMDDREMYGTIIGGGTGMSGAVYAATAKKPEKRRK